MRRLQICKTSAKSSTWVVSEKKSTKKSLIAYKNLKLTLLYILRVRLNTLLIWTRCWTIIQSLSRTTMVKQVMFIWCLWSCTRRICKISSKRTYSNSRKTLLRWARPGKISKTTWKTNLCKSWTWCSSGRTCGSAWSPQLLISENSASFFLNRLKRLRTIIFNLELSLGGNQTIKVPFSRNKTLGTLKRNKAQYDLWVLKRVNSKPKLAKKRGFSWLKTCTVGVIWCMKSTWSWLMRYSIHAKQFSRRGSSSLRRWLNLLSFTEICSSTT